MLKGMIAAVAMTFALAAPHAAEAAFEKKVALVIGNAAYENAPPLGNPVTDARAIAAAFERLGFETVTGFDLDRDGLQDTIRDFARASRKADLTAFFYAGHGIAFDDKNYIIPVDARFTDVTALDFEAVGMDFVVKQMRYNDGVSLVFIDACRDNPLASTLTRSMGSATRSAVSRGLADMDVKNAGRGLAIAFATSPGEVAYDGNEQHSPFTSALLNNIELAGVDITEVMSRVTGEVLRTTDDRQRPWLNASLTGPVVLKPAPAIATVTPAVEKPASDEAKAKIASLEADTKLFNFAYEKKSLAHYEAYLSTFPNGLYAAVARQEIERLSAAEAAEAKPVEVASLSPSAATASDAAADDASAGEDVAAVESEEAEVEGTAETEEALALDREGRRAIQHRLNMVEYDVGYADGLFGPMTRKGISEWQEEVGYAATGYLTEDQVAALEEATAEEFDAYIAEQNRIAAAAAERRAAAAAERRANAAAAAERRAAAASKARAAKTRSASKAAPRRTASAQTRSAPRQPQVERTYRMGRHTYEVRREPNRNNAAAALFVGGVVGGIIGGAIGR